MKKTNFLSRWAGVILPGLLMVLVAGCGTPHPEAIMAGTWKLATTSDSGLGETLLTFNQNGKLTEINFKIGVLTATYRDLSDRTIVNGDSLTIDSTFLGNGLLFNGILNSDQTVVVGKLTTQIKIPLLTITIDGGDATLTKQ
jgi:hypothetical protein